MKKGIALLSVSLLLALYVADAGAGDSKKISGEKEFKDHCASCHPDGGNIINPQKTLHKKDREVNNVKTEADIIGKMRKPGPGMTEFDKNTISDEKARAIARYILKTFK